MTVEQAAKQYALKYKHHVSSEGLENIQSDFIAGYEWALNNQWVPSEQFKRNSDDYLILLNNGEVRRYSEKKLPNALITHCMNIPPKQ